MSLLTYFFYFHPTTKRKNLLDLQAEMFVKFYDYQNFFYEDHKTCDIIRLSRLGLMEVLISGDPGSLAHG